jgi:hypothetical protein
MPTLKDHLISRISKKLGPLILKIYKRINPDPTVTIQLLKSNLGDRVISFVAQTLCDAVENYEPHPSISKKGFKWNERNSSRVALLKDLDVWFNLSPKDKSNETQAALSRVTSFTELLTGAIHDMLALFNSATQPIEPTPESTVLVQVLTKSLDIALAKYVDQHIEQHPELHPELHRFEREALQFETSLRRADALSAILRPAQGTRCVAVAYDAHHDVLCVGSNLNDDTVAVEVSNIIHERLFQLGNLCKTIARKAPTLSDMTHDQARKTIYNLLVGSSYLDSILGPSGLPLEVGETIPKKREKLTQSLTKIIHAFLFEPQSLSFGPDPLKLLTERRLKVFLPRLNHVEVNSAPVSSDTTTDFSFIDVQTTVPFAKTNSLHAEQLLAQYFKANQLELPFIGVSIMCCADCWKTLAENFPGIRLSGTHGRGYPGTVDTFTGNVRTNHGLKFDESLTLTRDNSDIYSAVVSPTEVATKLSSDNEFDTRAMMCDGGASGSMCSPKSVKIKPAALVELLSPENDFDTRSLVCGASGRSPKPEGTNASTAVVELLSSDNRCVTEYGAQVPLSVQLARPASVDVSVDTALRRLTMFSRHDLTNVPSNASLDRTSALDESLKDGFAVLDGSSNASGYVASINQSTSDTPSCWGHGPK